MHIGIHWVVRGNDEQQAAAEAAMRNALKGYSWFRPRGLSYYVIRVGGESDRQEIRSRLLEFARANPTIVSYVITPMMEGNYTGFLPKDLWPKLRERTEQAKAPEPEKAPAPEQVTGPDKGTS